MSEFIINEVPVDTEKLNQYLDGLIGKTFAVLGVYEDCTEQNNYEVFDAYIYRIICEMRGFYKLTQANSFISISSILEDLRTNVAEDCNREEKVVTHKRVKSLVFHCISIIKREKVV